MGRRSGSDKWVTKKFASASTRERVSQLVEERDERALTAAALQDDGDGLAVHGSSLRDTLGA
jgi:hypothetical protein